ncbi:MAG: hypothetical protein R3C49_11540 [Planctomycetaceae bacterium]
MRSMLIKLLPSRWMVAEQIQDLADAWRFVRSVEEVPDLSPDRLTAQFQDRLSEFGEHTNESPPESTTLSRELSIRGDEDFSAALNEAASLAFSRADDWYVHALQKLQVVSGEGNIFRSSLIRKLCRLRISRATAAAADVASLAGYLVNEATYRAFGRVPWWAATHRDNAVSSLLAQIRFLERTDAPRAETDCLICHAVMLSDESVPMGLRNYVLSMLSG